MRLTGQRGSRQQELRRSSPVRRQPCRRTHRLFRLHHARRRSGPDLPVLPGCGQIEVANFEGLQKSFPSRERCTRSRCCKPRLHPCRFHSRSQPSRHRPRRPTSRRIVRQAARYVRALLLARIYEVLVAIALMTVWSPVPCPDHPIRTVLPAAAACASPRSAVYRRRQPERTLLCRTVQTHLATWLAF